MFYCSKLGQNLSEISGSQDICKDTESNLGPSAPVFFSGSSATVTMVHSNVYRDVPQPHQRTIFQALKLEEPNTTSKVAHCLGFFEDQEIVESYKDSSGIRQMTAKTLFQRKSKVKFQGKVQNMDPLRGPDPWTGSIKI